MERLIRAERVIQTVVTAGLITGAQVEKESIGPFLRSFLGVEAAGWVVYSLAMVLIAAVFYFVGVAADLFFEHAAWARRLVLRDQFVEGLWSDVVVAPDGRLGGGIIDIFYNGGELQVSGTSYDRQGKWIGHFFSEHSMLCGNQLIYDYTKDPHARTGSVSEGHGSYTFHPRRRRPNKLTGFFSDHQTWQVYRVWGRKVDGVLQEDEHGEYVRKIIDEYEEKRAHPEASRAPEVA